LNHAYIASTSLFSSVLFTAPQIPAGMTGLQQNPVESSGMGPESTGMGLESTGMRLESTGMGPEFTGMGLEFTGMSD
jgi:hypothetical protein